MCRQRAAVALHLAAENAGHNVDINGEAPALYVHTAGVPTTPGRPANAPDGTRHPAHNINLFPVGQGPVGAAEQSVLVDQVPIKRDPSPNTAPGKAVHIAELGHGSVWLQYRHHHKRAHDQL